MNPFNFWIFSKSGCQRESLDGTMYERQLSAAELRLRQLIDLRQLGVDARVVKGGGL